MTYAQNPPVPFVNTNLETAVQLLSSEPGFFCIDARKAAGSAGRYSIMGFAPKNSIKLTGGFVTMDGHTAIDTPIEAFARFTKTADISPSDSYRPFCSGLFGYVGFEAAKAFRGFSPAKDFSRFPQCNFGLFGTLVVFDHVENISFIVCTEEHRADAYRLKENLENASPYRTAEWKWNDDAQDSRLLPEPSEHRRQAETAFTWLRSEEVERIHLVRHTEQPHMNTTAVDVFLSAAAPGEIAAMFTHEGATAILCSSETLTEIKNDDTTDLARHLTELLPVKRLTGQPYHKVMNYIDANESLHRGFYGGAFGTITSDGMRMFTAEKVITIMDGNIRRTSGADLTADMNTSVIGD